MTDHANWLREISSNVYLRRSSEALLAGAAAIEELAALRAALEWFVSNCRVDHNSEGWYVLWMHPQGDGEYDQGPVIDNDPTTALLGAYREAMAKK